MDRNTSQTLTAIAGIIIVVAAIFLRGRGGKENENGQGEHGGPVPSAAEPSIHLALGNPSQATDDPAHPDNYLMRKPYFALSYNDSRGGPNWVSWCLRESDLGPAPRSEFYPDPDLPRNFRRATPADYTGSGFDRGHMCPHSDRAATTEMSNATFVMTNIIPQSPHVNQRAWADLEDYTRGLVHRQPNRAVYIVSGGWGTGGEGSKGRADVIAGGRVTVPAKCWKVILVVEPGTGGHEDIAHVGPHSRAIAVIMPNDQSVAHDWPRYRTSIHEVESMTGYRFFDRVPGGMIDPLKAKVDDVHIAPSRHHTGD